MIGVGRQQQKPSDMHIGAIADIAGVVENCEKALSQAEPEDEPGPMFDAIDIRGLFDYSDAASDRYFSPDGDYDNSTSSSLDDLGQYGLSHIGLKRVSAAITGRNYDK